MVTSRSEKRFQLPNVDFTNGRRIVTNWAGDYRYLFDTGSTMTIASDLIAGELGLAQMTSDFDCLGGRDNGFFIDSVTMYGIAMHGITMHGIGGAYRVDNASVCWHQDKVKSVDAVIGSNLFEQVALILDGPNSLLGIRVGEHAQAPDVPGNLYRKMIPRKTTRHKAYRNRTANRRMLRCPGCMTRSWPKSPLQARKTSTSMRLNCSCVIWRPTCLPRIRPAAKITPP